MTRYLIEETISSQAVAALLKNPHDRTDATRQVFEAVSGRLEHCYVAYTENTAYLLADVPDQESLTAVMGAMHGGGGVMSWKAMPLMTASEAVDMLKKGGSLGYRSAAESLGA